VILFDTNVVSELMKSVPSSVVLQWVDSQERKELFVSAVTQAEILYGLERLPAGRRRNLFAEVVDQIFSTDFHNRVLPFDERCAHSYARIAIHRQRLGRPISQLDAMIAAIALSNGCAIATRDSTGFEHCGLKLLNPWQP